MRIPWWQSIRWRLALGSVLVTLLVTCLLALTAILAINYYYGGDQQSQMSSIALDRARRIGIDYVVAGSLARATDDVLPDATLQNTQDQQYLMIVLDRRYDRIYPRPIARNNAIATFLVRLADPTVQSADLTTVRAAIKDGQHGIASEKAIGRGFITQPFVVQPIFVGAQKGLPVLGVLIVTPRSMADKTIPPFVVNVGGAVLMASPIVALLAALVALFFSRTITRPIARLTKATRALAAGDYSAQVKTNARGEVGELAHHFNEMATQLNSDVEELRKQELWRRELIMSITHDLATPLTAIAGLGEALVDGVNQSHEDYEATGRIIVRETLRLRRLVQDLHMMAKVEAGALHPQRKEVRLAALVDEVLAVLIPEFERAHVEPCNAIPYTLPPVPADPDMLTRVLSNLCDNALHYTPSGGTVTIEAQQQGNELVIAVTDTGEGIPPEALSRIFERFFRADSARQSRTGGSGLGLAIVRAIVEAHGGRVWAENAPQAGARLLFTIPLQAAGQPSLSDATTLPLFKKGRS